MQGVFEEMPRWKAAQIAATEASRAVHAAQLTADEESGVVAGVELLLSSDACPLCRKVATEAKRVRLGDAFAVIGHNAHYSTVKHPPLHPHCQCAMIEILKPDWGGPEDVQWSETLQQPQQGLGDDYEPPAGVKVPNPEPDALKQPLPVKPPYSTPHWEAPERTPTPELPPREGDYELNPLPPGAEKLPPAPEPPKPPKPNPAAWPKDPDKLEVVRKLGGASGAELVKDADGKLYVRKRGTSPDHLREEDHADRLYRAVGAPVPKSKLYETKSGPVKLSAFEQGVTLAELMRTDPAAAERAMAALRKHFVADALFANWDVIGAPFDNILVTPAGVPLRIDNGGALRYRGFQGKKAASQWPGSLSELATLRDPNVNPATARVFGSLTDDEVRKQARAFLKKRAKLLKAAPDELKPALEQRLELLKQFAEAKPIRPTKSWQPRPASDFKVFKSAAELKSWGDANFKAWARGLSKAEHDAVGSYTGNGFRWMNPALYANDYSYANALGIPKATVDRDIATLRAALDKAKLPEAVLTQRGVGSLSDLGVSDRRQLVPGALIEEKSFSSTSPVSPWPKAVMMKMRLPKGAHAAWVNASPSSAHPDELEILLPPGGKYRVIEHQYSAGVDYLTVEAVP